MNEKKFRLFLETEWKRIEVDKWIAGERIKHDPGEKYTEEWINKFGKWFRDTWEVSLCKDCKRCNECGYKVKTECKGFKEEQNADG